MTGARPGGTGVPLTLFVFGVIIGALTFESNLTASRK